MVGAHGVCVGEAGRGVCVLQCATHHNGAGKSVVVIPWGISVTMQKYVIKVCTAARQLCVQCVSNFHISGIYLFCDLLGLRGRPSLDTLRGIAAELRSLKSEGGALISVPPVPAVRV